MTYTPVPLVSIGELYEASDFNTYYKDNFDASTGLVTIKGDLLVGTGSQVADRFPVGTNDHVLISDSAESKGIKWGSSGEVQTGMIILWSGSTGSIPSGWVICDGNNSTPDLRNRFVVGAGSTYAVNDSGGATALDISHTHARAGVVDNGAHSHTLTFGSENSHTHTVGPVDSGGPTATETLDSGSVFTNIASNTHVHQFPAESPGPSASHTHGKTFPSESDHSHTLTGNTGAASDESMPTIPPYYALAFIMKVAA